MIYHNFFLKKSEEKFVYMKNFRNFVLIFNTYKTIKDEKDDFVDERFCYASCYGTATKLT
ncbi:hypothetical protein RCZ04_16820 [Capnocytophaga sp. HP1101]